MSVECYVCGVPLRPGDEVVALFIGDEKPLPLCLTCGAEVRDGYLAARTDIVLPDEAATDQAQSRQVRRRREREARKRCAV